MADLPGQAADLERTRGRFRRNPQCIAIIGFIVTSPQNDHVLGFNSLTISIVILLFAIVCFFVSLEFFILGIYRYERIATFALWGSCCYLIGNISMIVGIAYSLIFFDLKALSWVILGLTLAGYSIYYVRRLVANLIEESNRSRNFFRVLAFIMLAIGLLINIFLE